LVNPDKTAVGKKAETLSGCVDRDACDARGGLGWIRTMKPVQTAQFHRKLKSKGPSSVSITEWCLMFFQ